MAMKLTKFARGVAVAVRAKRRAKGHALAVPPAKTKALAAKAAPKSNRKAAPKAARRSGPRFPKWFTEIDMDDLLHANGFRCDSKRCDCWKPSKAVEGCDFYTSRKASKMRKEFRNTTFADILANKDKWLNSLNRS